MSNYQFKTILSYKKTTGPDVPYKYLLLKQ